MIGRAAGAQAAPPATAQARRSRLRAVSSSNALLLSVGTVASGVLAYAFNVVAARTLGPAAYGPVALLWAGMFLVSVVLFRPIEQTLSRGIAERAARGQDARPVVRSVARVTLVATLASAAAAALAWTPLTDGLFAGQHVLTLALVVGIAGYGVSYFVRGVASGVLWFDGYGLLLLADGAVRLLLVLPLFFVASAAVAAGAIAAAAIGGAVAPLLTRAWRRGAAGGEGPVAERLEGDDAPAFELGPRARLRRARGRDRRGRSGARERRTAAGGHRRRGGRRRRGGHGLRGDDARARARVPVPGPGREPAPEPHPLQHARRRGRLPPPPGHDLPGAAGLRRRADARRPGLRPGGHGADLRRRLRRGPRPT